MRRREFITLAGAVASSWLPLLGVRADERVIKIVVLGDSLTAGSGIPAGHRFTDQLEFALRAKGQSAAVINAGVGGDTAARGLARLSRSVPDDTDAVILELGANDMLREVDTSAARAALAEILGSLEARRIVVLLCGARPAPPFETNTRAHSPQCFLALPVSTMCCSTRISTTHLWTIHNSNSWTACTQTQLESKPSSRAYCQMSKP